MRESGPRLVKHCARPAYELSSQYAELLECAGVDTVKELKNRNAENLAAKMAEVNDAKNLVRRPPSSAVVSDWVAQAKKLPGIITY